MVSLKTELPFRPNSTYAYAKSWFENGKLTFKDVYKAVKEAEKAADWVIEKFGLITCENH